MWENGLEKLWGLQPSGFEVSSSSREVSHVNISAHVGWDIDEGDGPCQFQLHLHPSETSALSPALCNYRSANFT